MNRCARMAMLVGALTLGGCATHTLREFTSDGCSLFPDGPVAGEACWAGCCVTHDAAYWRGGTEEERKAADTALRECVTRTGRPDTAGLMYRGTRFGGGPWLPTWYRWAYGWSYGRGYAPLTPAEQQGAAEQLAAYRRANPPSSCSAR